MGMTCEYEGAGGSRQGDNECEEARGKSTSRCGKWWRIAVTTRFVEATATCENTERIGSGDVESGKAVEEPQPEDVPAEKAPGGSKECACNGELSAPSLLLLEKKFGEQIYLADLACEAGKRIVVQVAMETKDWPLAFQFFMHVGVPAPSGPPAVYQSQREVGIPVTVSDPSIDEPNLPGESHPGIAVHIAAAESPFEFGPQGKGYLFVGIEAKRPVETGEVKCGILGIAKALPLQRDHLRTKFGSNGSAFIGRVVERHDNL